MRVLSSVLTFSHSGITREAVPSELVTCLLKADCITTTWCEGSAFCAWRTDACTKQSVLLEVMSGIAILSALGVVHSLTKVYTTVNVWVAPTGHVVRRANITAVATAAVYEKLCCCYQCTKSCMLYSMVRVVKAESCVVAKFVLHCLKADLESGGDVKMLLHVSAQNLIDADRPHMRDCL